jgi:hypothetical protein
MICKQTDKVDLDKVDQYTLKRGKAQADTRISIGSQYGGVKYSQNDTAQAEDKGDGNSCLENYVPQ